MPDRKRGSRTPSHSPEEANQQKDTPKEGEPPLFPISFHDVVLYDTQIQRFPERLGQVLTPTGVSNIEVQQPLLVGQRLEIGIKLDIRVPNEEEPAFTIQARINGVFAVAEGTDQELINAFSQSSAPFLIWPYARELIQNLTVRMRVLPLVLPTLDMRSVPQPQLMTDEASTAKPTDMRPSAEQSE